MECERETTIQATEFSNLRRFLQGKIRTCLAAPTRARKWGSKVRCMYLTRKDLGRCARNFVLTFSNDLQQWAFLRLNTFKPFVHQEMISCCGCTVGGTFYFFRFFSACSFCSIHFYLCGPMTRAHSCVILRSSVTPTTLLSIRQDIWRDWESVIVKKKLQIIEIMRVQLSILLLSTIACTAFSAEDSEKERSEYRFNPHLRKQPCPLSFISQMNVQGVFFCCCLTEYLG